MDASANWLGSEDATIVAGLDQRPVDYTPWFNSATDIDLVAAGFQPDYAYLHVDDDSVQTGTLTSDPGRHQCSQLRTAQSTSGMERTMAVSCWICRSPSNLKTVPEVTILHGGLTSPAIYVVSIRSSDVTMDGFTVTNPLYNEPGGDTSGIVAAYYGDPIISNINILNNIVTQIGADTRLLTDPNLHWVGTGIVSAGVVDDMTISNNVVYNIHHTNAGGPGNNLSPVGIGIYGQDDQAFTTNVVVSGNEIYDISAINTEGATGAGFGVAIGWASGRTTVENNLIHDVTGRGISTSLYTYDLVDILGNTLYNIGQTAIMFRSEPGGSILSNNIYDSAAAITFGTTISTPPVVEYNRIFNNTVGVDNLSTIAVTADNNWWGCNEGPNDAVGDCDATEGLVDAE